MLDKRGQVSVWIADFRTDKQLARYFEELYFDDELHASKFVVEFGLDDYDDQGIEAHQSEEKPIAEVLAQLSHSEAFLEPARRRAFELGILRATTAIAIYDYAFTPDPDQKPKGKRQAVFLGTFDYQ